MTKNETNYSIDTSKSEKNVQDEQKELWTTEYLRESIYHSLAGTKVIIEYQSKKVTVRKYYNQALRLWKWIPISKPTPKFQISISDLSSKILSELERLDKWTLDYVMKLAVGQIFENIDSKYYRQHIAKRLEVVFDK